MSSLNIFVLDQEQPKAPAPQHQARGSVFFENTTQPVRMALGTALPPDELAPRVCYYSLENGGSVVCTGGGGAPSASARRS